MPTLIYTLSHPLTKDVRYVGKTSRTLRQRLSQHISKSKSPATPCGWWIKKLQDEGLCPNIDLIETVQDDSDWEECERHWISIYRDRGSSLLNLRDGGQGPTGWHHRESTRQKVSATRIAKGLGQGPSLSIRSTTPRPKNRKGTKSEVWYREITRSNSGANNGQAKLSETVAQQIKIQAILGELTYQQIGDIYGVSRTLVGMIRRGDRWSHLPDF